MRSEAITDKSDMKAGVVAKVQQREAKKKQIGEKQKMQQPRREKGGETRKRKELVNM